MLCEAGSPGLPLTDRRSHFKSLDENQRVEFEVGQDRRARRPRTCELSIDSAGTAPVGAVPIW